MSAAQEMEGASLTQWLTRLETLHPNPIDLGLERVAGVARKLGLLPVNVPVVTVAGTNGKGTTVAVLEAVLEQKGLHTGVYTSPHLLRFNERIRVGSTEATDGEIVAAFKAIDDARGEISLTYFEFATLAALSVFHSRSVDVLVLEVGLGGRLDAVNIVDPTVAVITRIDLDHQSWLGSDRGSIAREKAGILRRGVPAVIGDPDPPAQLLACAAAAGATPVLRLGVDFTCDVQVGGWQALLRGEGGSLVPVPSQVAGPLIPANICTALQAALLLGCDTGDEKLADTLQQLRLRGRCEHQIIAGLEYVLDVAHNPAAVYNLVEYLSITPCKGKTICVFSVMEDKPISAMITAASGAFAAWFVADQPANPRAAPAVDVASALRSVGHEVVSISKNPRQALRRAQGAMSDGDRLVVFGSFTTVAAILPLLEQERGALGSGT